MRLATKLQRFSQAELWQKPLGIGGLRSLTAQMCFSSYPTSNVKALLTAAARPQARPSSSLTVDGEVVEGVEEFVYLGSKQTSDGYCRPEVMRRIGLASAVMSLLRSVWNNHQLCVDTKVHVYRALVQSVLLYGPETWTLLASDIKKLEAFHLRCQRQLLVSAGGTTLLMRRCANKTDVNHRTYIEKAYVTIWSYRST